MTFPKIVVLMIHFTVYPSKNPTATVPGTIEFVCDARTGECNGPSYRVSDCGHVQIEYTIPVFPGRRTVAYCDKDSEVKFTHIDKWKKIPLTGLKVAP